MKPFPEFAILSEFTTMRLTKVSDGMGHYYRPAGAWGTWAKWDGDQLVCHYPAMHHLHGEKFREITEEEFMKDNAGYV